MLVIIFLFVNFIFLFLAFFIIITDILKAIKGQPRDAELGETPIKEIPINKRGYLFGILSLLSMVFLSLNYIGA